MKDKYKVHTKYVINLKVGDYDSAEIIQEEDVKGRNAIQISFFPPERWRTPEATVQMLRELAGLIEKTFCDK